MVRVLGVEAQARSFLSTGFGMKKATSGMQLSSGALPSLFCLENTHPSIPSQAGHSRKPPDQGSDSHGSSASHHHAQCAAT